MRSYFKIIFKGFLRFRKKRKNLTLVLAGSFFLIIFLISLFNTIFINLEDYWGKMLLGSGSIIVDKYKSFRTFKPPKEEFFFSTAQLDQQLKQLKDIDFSKRVRIFGLIEGYKSEIQKPMIFIGMESDKEQAIISNLQLVEGKFPESGEKEICLFYESAGRLVVNIGEKVIIYIKNFDGYMDYDVLTVVGILAPKKVQYFFGSEMIGFIPRKFAASIKGVKEDYVSEIAFSTNNIFSKFKLEHLLPDSLKIVNMWESEEVPLSMRWICNFLFWIMIILIVGVVFSSIYHNIHLMILERYKEIGIYLSYGASYKWILKIWMGELSIYIIYCALIGGFFSTLFIFGINSVEFYALSREMEILMCTDTFYISLLPGNYLYSFLIIWLVVIAAAVYPMLKGVNEKIIVKLFRK